MSEIVGIFAASHTPVMLNFPDAIPDEDRGKIFSAFEALGKTISAAKPDALVILSDDHLHNFFLTNYPAICIGAAQTYDSPVEHWLKASKRIFPGHVDLGAYLVQQALQADFDPAFSMELVLDHGSLTPIELAKLANDVPIVPILINCVQPPLPTMARCLQFGRFLGRALRAYTGADRIAVLATGGISHDISTPRMGMVNEAFDRTLLSLFEAGDDEATARFAADHVHEAGNGAEEIRMWVSAMGIAAGAPFRTHFYKAVANWYTGIGIGEWDVGAVREAAE